jgi:hypothetical protein
MGSMPHNLIETADSEAELVDRLATEIEIDYVTSMRKVSEHRPQWSQQQ